jgi:hypothetical protein
MTAPAAEASRPPPRRAARAHPCRQIRQLCATPSAQSRPSHPAPNTPSRKQSLQHHPPRAPQHPRNLPGGARVDLDFSNPPRRSPTAASASAAGANVTGATPQTRPPPGGIIPDRFEASRASLRRLGIRLRFRRRPGWCWRRRRGARWPIWRPRRVGRSAMAGCSSERASRGSACRRGRRRAECS